MSVGRGRCFLERRIIGSALLVCAVMCALLESSLPTLGQDDGAVAATGKGKGKQKGAKAKSGPTPRLADGKVDLAGTLESRS